jgi:aspartokinase
VLRELSRGRVVVVPGGEALGEDGKWATLGVGGRVEGSERATSADVTAVFIAAALGADVRCVRDVDGVYESDPLRRSGGRPRRFRSITWELLESVAPGIVSVRAGEIARAKGVRVRVASPGSEDGTELGVATGFDSPVLPREAATARAMFAAVA